jgi:hypothetical protein
MTRGAHEQAWPVSPIAIALGALMKNAHTLEKEANGWRRGQRAPKVPSGISNSR